MESRGRKILRMVKNKFNIPARTINEPQINENLEKSIFEEYNSFNKTNATPKINSTLMVEQWIDSIDFENQDPIPMIPKMTGAINSSTITVSAMEDPKPTIPETTEAINSSLTTISAM